MVTPRLPWEKLRGTPQNRNIHPGNGLKSQIHESSLNQDFRSIFTHWFFVP